MKKRHLITAGVMAACVGLVLGVLAMLPPSPGVTKANFDRIEIGMTMTEVEAILGSHCVGPVVNHNIYWWRDDKGFGSGDAIVHFDGGDLVTELEWEPLSLELRIGRWRASRRQHVSSRPAAFRLKSSFRPRPGSVQGCLYKKRLHSDIRFVAKDYHIDVCVIG